MSVRAASDHGDVALLNGRTRWEDTLLAFSGRELVTKGEMLSRETIKTGA